MKKHLSRSKMISLLIVMTLFSFVGNKLYAQENQILKSATAAAAISNADSLVLVDFYSSTNGANWTNKSNWLAGPIRTWYGITVVAEQITEIKLKDNNLVGSIPAGLGDLLSLQYLDLDTNQLSGVIPVELGQLNNLEYLYLNGNLLTDTIPSELGQLTNLILLYLNNNQLTGTIPANLNLLTNLKWLNLSRNQLTGTIPFELGQLPSLEYLQLADNQLSGSIPVELGGLPKLRWLNLGNNLLTGSIPVELGLLSNVFFEQLYLNGNQLTGDIPTALGNLTALRWLNLGQNQLTGAIPGEFSTLSKLELLYLDGNQLTTIPVDLGLLTGLQWLNLSDNLFTGDIPAHIWDLTNLSLLYLNGNQLTGNVPANLNLLPRLKWLYLNSNQLVSIPDFTVDADSLQELMVENNQLAFDHLEYNMDLLPAVSFTYFPQDSIGTTATFLKNEGDNFSDTLSTGGTQNNYQWYKDGEILSTQTDAILLINNLTAADAGKYYCKVTNTLVPGLTLTSRKITLTVKLCVKLVFNVGWNIFSSPVILDPAKMDSIFKPFIVNESLVKIQDEGGGTFENRGVFGGWTNNIGDIVTTEGYKIKMSIKDSVVICGLPVEYPFEIPLKQGWNIMGYPQIAEFSGMDVVQTLIDKKVLIKVQDEKGGTIEDRGVYGGWTNGIGSFITGEGYKIKVTKDTSLWINESYPKSNVILPEIVASTHFKPAFEGNGVDHMNINLVTLTGSEILEGDEIGIFDGNICVGSTKIARQNSSVINVIASADEGNPVSNGFRPGNQIQMKLFRNGKEYALEMVPLNSSSNQFEKNGTIFATVNTALNTGIDLPENEFSVACYPNPFNQVLNIEINLQQREELTVEIYDLLSRRINQLYNGSAEGMIKLQWDANDSQGNRVAPGVYVCRVNGLWKKIVLN